MIYPINSRYTTFKNSWCVLSKSSPPCKNITHFCLHIPKIPPWTLYPLHHRLITTSLLIYHQNNLLKSVIQAGSKEGVLFLAAAGNEPTGLPVYPAAQSEVVGVTALNRNGQRVASYANNANFVEVAAPGVGVTVLNNQTYFGTGTSFSTAYTAGVAAAISSSQNLQMNQVRDAITKSMKPPTTRP